MANVASLTAQVRAHPMCLTFEDDGRYFRVIYPAGMYPNGAQSSYGDGKAAALTRILNVMERHWRKHGIQI